MRPEDVIQELQRVAKALGKNSLARSEFGRHGGRFSTSTVEKTFGSWNGAIEAAGLLPTTRYRGLPDDDLLREFERVSTLLGRIPTRSQFAAHSQLSTGVYDRRFGKWSAAVAHYTGVATKHPTKRTRRVTTPYTTGPEQHPKPDISPQSRRRFGPPLDFRGLRHEPLSELGVVFLFGMVASDLGFLVEVITPEYPDCTAKRRVKTGNQVHYESVNVEFEFKSSRFNHDPSGCDLVVCWEHDWPDCPVEVLELKSAITHLRVAND